MKVSVSLIVATACVACLPAFGEPVAKVEANTIASRDTSARPWLDTKLEIDERVRLLLDRMQLDEKIGQLSQASSVGADVAGSNAAAEARQALENDISSGRTGSVLNEANSEVIAGLQKVAVEKSRLGVPLIFGRDVIHGFRTIFPIPLGQAASWNPELAESAAAISAREARSVGIHWTFAPMVDIARDARWGRIAESLGEDPKLASAFSAAMVRGFQGKDLAAPDRIAACAKHFVGYGAAEGGRDYNGAMLSLATLHNVYLPPFHAAVDAEVATLMTAFNELNGVPGGANKHLLQEVLRQQWKFQGFVVSDWESIREMIVHGYSGDESDAAMAAIRAGVNMEMVSRIYRDQLPKLMAQGEISEATLNELVTAVLRIKLRLGLFEEPYASVPQSSLLAAEHLESARQLARQSVVLLKNKDRLLPLDHSRVKTIAVIGPLADDKEAQLGAWSLDGQPKDSRTLLAAMREMAGAETNILFAPGLANDLDVHTAGFDAAVAAALKSEIVVLVVGEGAKLSGEAHSRAILELPGAQNELIDAVAATGKPIVLVVEAGRPLAMGRQFEKASSVLYSFHAGTMAGPAIADLLWGVESPSGKLPVTFPRSVGQEPLYYNHANTGRPPRPFDSDPVAAIAEHYVPEVNNTSNYLDVGPYPLFPFGYGLSYSTFEYGPVELSAKQFSANSTVEVNAKIANTGKVTADEVVQFYIHRTAGSMVPPVRELKGFQRVRLRPGESKSVVFSLSAKDVSFFNNEEKLMAEPGKVELFVGGSSQAPLVGEVEFKK